MVHHIGKIRNQSHRTSSHQIGPFAIGLSVFFLCACIVAALATKMHHDDREHAISRLQNDAEVLGSVIKVDLTSRFRSLQRMADRWSKRGGTPRDEFLADAAAYVKDQPGYHAIARVDTDYYVRWIEPLAGNEAAINLNLGKEQRRRTALEKARAKSTPTLSRPIDLIQEGGKGMLVYFPVFRKGRFDGFILAVLQIETWLSELFSNRHFEGAAIAVGGVQVNNSLLVDLSKRMNFAIRIDDTQVHVSKIGELTSNLPNAQVEFEFADQPFNVTVLPTKEFLEQNSSGLAAGVTMFGLAFSVGIGFTISLLYIASHQRNIARDAQTHLNTMQDLLLASINAMRNGFAIWSSEDKLIMANGAYKRFFGSAQSLIEPGLCYDVNRAGFAGGCLV